MLNNTNLNFDKDGGKNGKKRFPNISFVNIADLQGDGGIPNRQKLKKKKPKENKEKAVFNINDLPAPHRIKAQLDDFVVGHRRDMLVNTDPFSVSETGCINQNEKKKNLNLRGCHITNN